MDSEYLWSNLARRRTIGRCKHWIEACRTRNLPIEPAAQWSGWSDGTMAGQEEKAGVEEETGKTARMETIPSPGTTEGERLGQAVWVGENIGEG